jgi:hypothetical protein
MGKKRDATKTDFSSFMCVILMLTGALVTIMISNVVIIAANPENVQITSIIPSGFDPSTEKEVEDSTGNVTKNPWYLEVWRDRMIIHPTGEEIIMSELEVEGKQLREVPGPGGGPEEQPVHRAAGARKLGRPGAAAQAGHPRSPRLIPAWTCFTKPGSHYAAQLLHQPPSGALQRTNRHPRRNKPWPRSKGTHLINLDSFLDILTCLQGVLILVIISTGIDAAQTKVLIPTPIERRSAPKSRSIWSAGAI